MTRTPRRAPTLGRAAGLALAVLALASCAQFDRVGSAALVGDDRISVADVQREARDFVSELPEEQRPEPGWDATELQNRILTRLIDRDLMAEVARREGIEVPDAAIDSFIDEELPPIAANSGTDVPTFLASLGLTTETAREVVFSELVRRALLTSEGSPQAAQRVVDQVVEDLGVEVNPRYGRWDGGLVRGTGSISTQADG